MAMALAFHELAVNAADHGALSQDQGRLRVSWALADDGEDKRLNLEWLERNGPHVSAREHSGFGSRYLERGLTYELQAGVQLRFEPDGVSCSIEIPFPEPSAATGASSLGNAEDTFRSKPETNI
jgi:two-component sensor histidine kinase